MPYADGFVVVVEKKKLKAYEKHAKKMARIFLELGALEFRECVGDDLEIPFGVPFPKLAKTKKGETVVFSWIVFKSRAHRDRVLARTMKDPRCLAECEHSNLPFDVARMSCGGFRMLVDARR
jgi:uncharacterized protein YbaA (DUF1428 family)